MSRRAAVTAVVVVAVAAFALAGCSNRQPPRFKGAQSQQAVTATAGPNGEQRVVIEANDADRFVPDTVVMKPGKVTIVVRNVGAVPHTFEIPALHVNTGNIGKHQTRQVSFTVTTPGTYRFDCAYHLTLHMDGTLRVVKG